MTVNFTHDDLIRYVYDETSEDENREIRKALATNGELAEQYSELLKLKQQLDGSFKRPSEKVTKNILEYSKAFNLHAIKD